MTSSAVTDFGNLVVAAMKLGDYNATGAQSQLVRAALFGAAGLLMAFVAITRLRRR